MGLVALKRPLSPAGVLSLSQQVHLSPCLLWTFVCIVLVKEEVVAPSALAHRMEGGSSLVVVVEEHIRVVGSSNSPVVVVVAVRGFAQQQHLGEVGPLHFQQ